MRNLPVHWYEGLFLRPQHFQAAERSWTEALQTSDRYDHHYPYGLRRFAFSEEAIGNYQFQVLVCEARMRDGTLLAFSDFLDDKIRVYSVPGFEALAAGGGGRSGERLEDMVKD